MVLTHFESFTIRFHYHCCIYHYCILHTFSASFHLFISYHVSMFYRIRSFVIAFVFRRIRCICIQITIGLLMRTADSSATYIYHFIAGVCNDRTKGRRTHFRFEYNEPSSRSRGSPSRGAERETRARKGESGKHEGHLLSCAITSDASPHTGTSATPTVQVRETDPGRRWRGVLSYIDGAPALPWLAFVLL